MVKLIGFQTSPWTEKARWALDARHIEYDYEEYVPLISEPALRLRVGVRKSRVTVPTLLQPTGKPLMDSYDIARWAQRNGGGSTLFPEHLHTKIAHINAESEQILHILRAHFTHSLLNHPEAKKEQLPPFIPKPLYGMANLGLWYISQKYALPKLSQQELHQHIEPTLTHWQELKGDKDTIFDQWSYADIIVASTLNFIKPHPTRSSGPASDQCQTIDSLAEQFKSLLQWRDEVYAKYRITP